MKEILDIIIVILFVVILAVFIIGFNRQMMKKHKDRLDEIEKHNKDKDNIND